MEKTAGKLGVSEQLHVKLSLDLTVDFLICCEIFPAQTEKLQHDAMSAFIWDGKWRR